VAVADADGDAELPDAAACATSRASRPALYTTQTHHTATASTNTTVRNTG
jgi:hypothetical protein